MGFRASDLDATVTGPSPEVMWLLQFLLAAVGLPDEYDAASELSVLWAREADGEAAAFRVAALHNVELLASEFLALLPAILQGTQADAFYCASPAEVGRFSYHFLTTHRPLPPRHTGERVSAGAISSYTCQNTPAIRAHRSRETGYPITVPHMSLRLAKQAQNMRQEDGPAGARGLVRAFTARFLARLARQPSFDKASARGRLRWAVLVVGHNLLLRSVEFGVPDGKVFDSARGISVVDWDWVAPQHDTDGFEVAVAEVHPVKDAQLSR